MQACTFIRRFVDSTTSYQQPAKQTNKPFPYPQTNRPPPIPTPILISPISKHPPFLLLLPSLSL